MNRKMLENAIENVFSKNLDYLHTETAYTTDGETFNNQEIVSFTRVEDTCAQIKKEILEMLCEGED